MKPLRDAECCVLCKHASLQYKPPRCGRGNAGCVKPRIKWWTVCDDFERGQPPRCTLNKDEDESDGNA